MVGIMLLVFARTALCDAVSHIAAADVGTGLLGVLVRRRVSYLCTVLQLSLMC